MLQLFKFIQADLNSFKPKPKNEYPNGFADATTSAFDPVGTIDPDFPKSLYLLQPLFCGYDLNPVAEDAQASVPVPEGLDLDDWSVPRAKPSAPGEEKRKKKDKKGKGKDTGADSARSSKTSRKSKKGDEQGHERSREEILAEQEELAKGTCAVWIFCARKLTD